MARWHYTSVSWMDAWMRMSRAEMESGDAAAGKLDAVATMALAAQTQAEILDEHGEAGWDVYEIKFDSDGHALYFLRLDLDQ